MILEAISIIAAVAVGLGIGLQIGSKAKEVGSPTVKVIKASYVSTGDIFINMIENGDKRTIHYLYKESGLIPDNDAGEDYLKRSIPAVFNHMMLWINFDVNTYPDVSSMLGVSYV